MRRLSNIAVLTWLIGAVVLGGSGCFDATFEVKEESVITADRDSIVLHHDYDTGSASTLTVEGEQWFLFDDGKLLHFVTEMDSEAGRTTNSSVSSIPAEKAVATFAELARLGIPSMTGTEIKACHSEARFKLLSDHGTKVTLSIGFGDVNVSLQARSFDERVALHPECAAYATLRDAILAVEEAIGVDHVH